MSDDLYRGRHRAPAGRHRVVSDPRSGGLPRLTRPGFLLPTAAAATLALTATGAHLGGSLTVSGLGQAATQNAVLGTTGATVAAGTSATGNPGNPGDTVERIDTDRVARGADRSSAGTSPDATDALPDGATNATDVTNTNSTAAASAAEADAKVAADAAAATAADAQAVQAVADAKAAAHAWVSPIAADSGFQLTSGFGMRWGAMHPGQDFAVGVGTPVRALSSGTVLFAGWQGGYGNKLEIQYWDGTVSWYAHNSKLLVSQGDTVTPGEQVSLSGNTGHSTGPHMHMEIHPGNGDPVPPVPWLTAKGIMP